MANVKISELPAATSGADANEFEINESGTSKKLSGSNLKSYVLTSPTATGTLSAPTINASTELQIGGTAITATAAELNYVDGVTSSIQTQLDNAASTGKAIAMAIVFG